LFNPETVVEVLLRRAAGKFNPDEHGESVSPHEVADKRSA
jgi:hypothetical protein